MTRKARVDSISEAARIVSQSGKRIDPPSNIKMTDADLVHFANVIDEFARADWTAHQLEIAAMLARAMADQLAEQDALRNEGSVAYTEKGTPVANPRKTIVQMYSSTILSLRKSLALDARSQGQKADLAKSKTMAKALEAAADVEDDGLLARPN